MMDWILAQRIWVSGVHHHDHHSKQGWNTTMDNQLVYPPVITIGNEEPAFFNGKATTQWINMFWWDMGLANWLVIGRKSPTKFWANHDKSMQSIHQSTNSVAYPSRWFCCQPVALVNPKPPAIALENTNSLFTTEPWRNQRQKHRKEGPARCEVHVVNPKWICNLWMMHDNAG
jgi:hypothetical protein